VDPAPLRTAEEVYERHVRRLPPSERLRLLAMTTGDLAESREAPTGGNRDIMELHGLGAAVWEAEMPRST
jgi:hypothetical protein